MIVRAAPSDHYGWIAERSQLIIGGQFRAIEAIDDSGRIHGMVGYDGWTDNAVWIHIALDNPAALRHLLTPGFGIPFEELNKGLVLASILSTNRASIDLVVHLGFSQVSRIRDMWQPGVDMLAFEMRRENCRWLNLARKVA